MPSTKCLLASFGLALAHTAFAVQDCDLNGVHVNPANGATTAGKTGIMRCRDRDSGEIQREQELRDGKFIGIVRYFKSARLEREYTVNDKGNKDGLSREFAPDTGKVIREATYRNGTAVGVYRSFFPDGQRRRVGFYDDKGKELAAVEYNGRNQLLDLRCGPQPLLGKEVDEIGLCGFAAKTPVVTVLVGPKGEPKGRVTYLQGRLIGNETQGEDGKPRYQSLLAEDDSEIERSYSHGVLRKEVRWVPTDRGRVKDSEKEFHESGTLIVERRWKSGEPDSERIFYLNGQPRSDTRFSRRDGKLFSERKEFHDNGKPAFEGGFVNASRHNPTPTGEHRRFDSDGRLRKISTFDGAGRLTRERELDDKGTVIRDDAVFEDGSRKAFAVQR